MGGFFKELWPFGDKDDEKPKPVPPDKVEPPGIDPHEPPPGVTPGDPIDEGPGDPVLARTVDIGKSRHWILPPDQLSAPGDKVTLNARIVDVNNKPVVGLPVWFVIKATRKQIGDRKQTDAKGEVSIPYTVEADDMSGDPRTPEPDMGSYLVNCYAGGRPLTQVSILYDAW